MRMLDARSVLTLNENQLWALDDQYEPLEPIKISFDDVDMAGCTIRETIISWYFWKLLVLYPETPLLAQHHLHEERMGGSTPITHMTRITRSIIDTYGDRLDYDLFTRQIYQTMNDVYNMVVEHLGAFVETMDARHYVEVLNHPEIQAIRQKCIEGGTPKHIRELNEAIPKLLKDPNFLPGNPQAETVRQKTVSVGQALQCIGIIGIRTDIDSTLFREPILECFATGTKNIWDFMKESRSASKALMFQKDPIRDTEYFNRRLQLLFQVIRYLIPGDCGSTYTIPWEVQSGDLEGLNGKYYYDKDGVLQCINPKDTKSLSLIGKTIQLRSPTMCLHTARGAVCECCAGRISKSIPRGTNLGHVAAYSIGEKITQNVLSTKHLDGSAVVRDIDLDKEDIKTVYLDKEDNTIIKLQKRLQKHEGLRLVLSVEEVSNLPQIMEARNIEGLSIFKISRITKIGVRFWEEDMEVLNWAMVSGPSRPSSLSRPMIKYIRENRYKQHDTKFIEIDLSKWDFDQPVFVLPQRQINMLDFMKAFAQMLECNPNEKDSVKKGLNASKPEDIAAYIRAVYEFSSQYIHIPIMYLEIATLALMIRSAEDEDYRLVDVHGSRDWASNSAIMQKRSMSSALAYEEQANTILNSKSYSKIHRPSHPMDTLFMSNLNPEFFDKWKKYFEKNE